MHSTSWLFKGQITLLGFKKKNSVIHKPFIAIESNLGTGLPSLLLDFFALCHVLTKYVSLAQSGTVNTRSRVQRDPNENKRTLEAASFSHGIQS